MVSRTQIHMPAAEISEEFAEEFYANRVDLIEIIKSTHWASVNLSINAGGKSTLFDEERRKAEQNFLLRSRVSAQLDETTVVVRVGGAVFYTLDISTLMHYKQDTWNVEVLVGTGIGQLVLLFIDDAGFGRRPWFYNSEDLNPHSQPLCEQTYQDSYTKNQPIQCGRTENHDGSHQYIAPLSDERRYAVTHFSKGGAYQSWKYPFGIPTPCMECGYTLAGNGNPNTRCDTCSFWQSHLETQSRNNFIINGHQYKPGTGGFGGRKFFIERFDGTLWSGELFTQGEIPSHYRDRMPDNARFFDNS